jgi:hypothetical protein
MKKKADPDKAARTLGRYKKGLAKLGINYNRLRVLGAGTRGVAFSAKKSSFVQKLFSSSTSFEIEDKVLKVTDDASEAAASNVLVKLGKKSDHIVHIFKVIKFGESGYYGIILEKLDEMNASEAKEFNNAIQMSVLPIALSREPFSTWDETKELTEQIIREKFKDEFSEEQIKFMLNRARDAYDVLEKKFNVDKMVDELSSLGINYFDYHSGNVMKRADGTFVVLDLGYSKVARSDSDDYLTINEVIERRLKLLNRCIF